MDCWSSSRLTATTTPTEIQSKVKRDEDHDAATVPSSRPRQLDHATADESHEHPSGDVSRLTMPNNMLNGLSSPGNCVQKMIGFFLLHSAVCCLQEREPLIEQ